jgi:hypothetical protein
MYRNLFPGLDDAAYMSAADFTETLVNLIGDVTCASGAVTTKRKGGAQERDGKRRKSNDSLEDVGMLDSPMSTSTAFAHGISRGPKITKVCA